MYIDQNPSRSIRHHPFIVVDILTRDLDWNVSARDFGRHFQWRWILPYPTFFRGVCECVWVCVCFCVCPGNRSEPHCTKFHEVLIYFTCVSYRKYNNKLDTLSLSLSHTHIHTHTVHTTQSTFSRRWFPSSGWVYVLHIMFLHNLLLDVTPGDELNNSRNPRGSFAWSLRCTFCS